MSTILTLALQDLFSKHACPQVPWSLKRTDETNLFCMTPCAIKKVKKGNIKASNISCKIIGLHIYERCVQWMSYFPSMAIFNPAKKFDQGIFWSCATVGTYKIQYHYQKSTFTIAFRFYYQFFHIFWLIPLMQICK